MYQHLPVSFNALIQGASRGIGLALVRQLLEDEQVGQVFATSRDPFASEGLVSLVEEHGDRLQCLPLDLTREATISAAADVVDRQAGRLHLLFNVAGVLHNGGELFPEKQLGDVTADNLLTSFQVNAVGPLLVAKAFAPLLTHGEPAVLANMSARVGSIGDNRLGGWYAYRGAKAAQNMFTRGLAVELGRRSRQFVCVALHPGTTDTALSAPFQKRVPADKLFTTERTARQLLQIIASLTSADSGRFIAWDGQDIPW